MFNEFCLITKICCEMWC